MLNANFYALKAALNEVNKYKNSNKQIYKENKEAYIKIKTAVNNECTVYAIYQNENGVSLEFFDPEGYTISVEFCDFYQSDIASIFYETYKNAQKINKACGFLDD
jgi:hypothetical protein